MQVAIDFEKAKTPNTLRLVRDAGEDHEWYPTTDRMVDVVAKRIGSETTESIMDIGAGDGRVLTRLARKCDKATLYSIEKSSVLMQAQPENIIPVGTEFFEQNLACLPVSVIFCNPPYSQYETWVTRIVETGFAQRAFLVIPERWKDSAEIAAALKRRGATASLIGNDNFHDAERRARAVVDIVEVRFPKRESYGYRTAAEKVKDPFDIWFDQNVSTFDEEQASDYTATEAAERKELARVNALETVADMVAAHDEEFVRLEENYKAIFKLDYALLKELGVKKEAVREGVKAKMAGLKAKYWGVLFDKLDAIKIRLTTKSRAAFVEKLTARTSVAFTESNAYAIVIWAVKNANKYFDTQTVQLFRDLSTHDGVLNYKSNQRTWQKNGWRYIASDHSRYGLDYRIVVEGHTAIFNADYGGYKFPGNLAQEKHDLISDIVAVLRNLGFESPSLSSLGRTWTSGEWQDWDTPDFSATLFQIKAFKNGNVHLRFMPDAIKALNVAAGRLLGWLNSPADVETELGYTRQEAQRFFNNTLFLKPGEVPLLAQYTE